MRSMLIIVSCLACGAALAAEEKSIREARAPAQGAIASGQEASDGATAELKPTQGNSVSGSLSLTAVKGGVRIAGKVAGLKPGSEQGFHVHEKGDCSAPDASSAGDHFNPTARPHGDPKQQGQHHVGDMLNLKADAQGVANVDALIAGATLDARQTGVLRKAIVVHQKPDDYRTQPSGNSGDRVACAVIS